MNKEYCMNKQITQKGRFLEIDLMKTILVCGMILGHVGMLCGTNDSMTAKCFNLYINWTTFSGFFFVFGFLYYHIYFSRTKEKAQRSLLRNCIKLLLCYYISAFAYVIFVQGLSHLSLLRVAAIFALWSVPGYSEFLLSFFSVTLLTLLLYKYVKTLFDVNKCYTGGG